MVPHNKHTQFYHMGFMTSTLVMSNLLPAVTECSLLVLECAPLEHRGLTTSVRQTSYLGQGGILSFRSVGLVLAFLSTPHRFCSFLLRVVGLAG